MLLTWVDNIHGHITSLLLFTMFSRRRISFLSVLILTLIGECYGSQLCVGYFYKTALSSYYGQYRITTDYYHRYYGYNGYSQLGPKYCEDQCCTSSNGYKHCCSYYGVSPSYTSSSKPSSTRGIIAGCTIGGTLFTVVVIVSLLVSRCMWKDRKRIDPSSIESGSSKAADATGPKVDHLEHSSVIMPPSVNSTPGLEHTVKQ